MERTLYEAPAVVISTYILHSHPPDQYTFVEPELNYAILSVECILKSGDYTIGRNVNIWDQSPDGCLQLFIIS